MSNQRGEGVRTFLIPLLKSLHDQFKGSPLVDESHRYEQCGTVKKRRQKFRKLPFPVEFFV